MAPSRTRGCGKGFGSSGQLLQRLAEWRTAGRDRFSVAELAGLLEEVGRSRAWVYDQLDDLEGEGGHQQGRRVSGDGHILAAA